MWTKPMFETLKAHVLQDGHVDHITGPRCMVKMDEGPHIGRYRIADTETVLTKDTPVRVDRWGNAEVLTAIHLFT